MAFTGRTVGGAEDRQSIHDGCGWWCARCGEDTWKLGSQPIPRIPIELGGRWTIDNCVILCSNCVSVVKAKGVKEIPYDMIPFFDKCPPNWKAKHHDNF
jgi:5-methylcytosine-specific restriction endonuclease McrA